MQIHLVRKNRDLCDLIVRDQKIVEFYQRTAQSGNDLMVFLYDPKKNTLRELDAASPKASFIPIQVCYKSCHEVYYVVCDRNAEQVTIRIMASNLQNLQTREFYAFDESLDVLFGKKRIRIFVLSPTQLLVQTEVVDLEAIDSLMGNIVFSQTFYDASTQTTVEVIEENLHNNGIQTIVPFNENEIMIKTGFSYLEDSRLSYGSENEALIESIFTTSIAKFTADLMLQLTNIDMHLLCSTYFDRYILQPEVKDDYIFYTVVDVDHRTSECNFYNYNTGELLRGKNSNIDFHDLRVAYVIANTPYVRKYVERSCEFVNLLTAENDISFYEEDFVDVCGKLFITYRRHGRKNHMRVYQYPHMDVLLDEKCNYNDAVYYDNNYFLYIEKQTKEPSA